MYSILTMIDYHTRWVECVPLPDKTADTITSMWWIHWITRFGLPKIMVVDSDPSFQADLVKQMCAKLGVGKYTSAIERPKGNAPIETFHRHLRKALASAARETLLARSVSVRHDDLSSIPTCRDHGSHTSLCNTWHRHGHIAG